MKHFDISSIELERKFFNWLKDLNPLQVFISLAAVKVLDLFSAWSVYHFRPGLFARQEANQTLKNAFVGGEFLDFLILESLIYLAFILIALSLKGLSKREVGKLSMYLALLPVCLGILSLCLYSLTTATNVVNGFLTLSLLWPASKFIYAVVGFPLTALLLKFSWNIEGDMELGSAFLILALISLFLG